MAAPISAVLDASVLIPITLADTLLIAAEADLCDVRWSDDILEEVRRNLINARLTDSVRASHQRHAASFSARIS